ncbi:alpha-amylase family glycosyl hydrolase [Amnibacterium sp.]|uniref:alpha-amylase family glycosyl hydrolase n=1 Tax=Amnibacterium sp. TaxID=1872496 RepID=UPI00262DF25F|nr:alpha-amylase family glycosyl hydrolase [Amnibacterium sp.]MCU1475243.1 trehalose synthase [Amnibacterium sp.]
MPDEERSEDPRQEQGPGDSPDSPDWIHRAVIYGVDVLRFQDSDGDGNGDLKGLVARLDHVERLGADCLWLLPFYPSERRDNGYDVTNHLGVDPRIGELDDFRLLAEEAHARGIRLLLDLVLHHTSNRHPWFQAAESDPRSRFRDYYIWSETEPPDSVSASAFPNERGADGIWTRSERARAFYRHKFYDFEPDLRIASDALWEEVKGILDFWIALGADGFRIDAAGELFADIGLPGDQADAGRRLDDLRGYLRHRAPSVALLGEVDLAPEQLPTYFDRGRIDQLLAFLPNNALMLSLATEDAAPLCAAVARHDDAVRHGAWRQFLRNLDELNLSHLSDEQRQGVFDVFAPQEDERIYGRGIRRGWAPMMEHDRRKRMTISLLFALPGAPLLVAGQEIGTGDDLALPGRASVRLPMQWSAEDGGGFSTSQEGEAAHLVTEGPFGIRSVNVADQEADPGSLLHLVRALIRLWREHPEIASPRTDRLDADPAIAAFRYGSIAAAHNLAADPRPLPEAMAAGQLLLGDETVDGGLLPGHGFRWVLLP